MTSSRRRDIDKYRKWEREAHLKERYKMKKNISAEYRWLGTREEAEKIAVIYNRLYKEQTGEYATTFFYAVNTQDGWAVVEHIYATLTGRSHEQYVAKDPACRLLAKS